jgi:hypothetical protein
VKPGSHVGVEAAGGLVAEEKWRIGENLTGQGQTLRLSPRYALEKQRDHLYTAQSVHAAPDPQGMTMDPHGSWIQEQRN